jgi:hypothetical protein
LDIKPFALAYGQGNCRLIFIERIGMPIGGHLSKFGLTFLPKLMVRNREGKPEEMLEHIGQMLPEGINIGVNNPNPKPIGEVPDVPRPERSPTAEPPEPSDL